ncbi:hypothetical protein ACWEQ4_01310 [Rhodococcus sp. NPDC003994]
MKMPELKSVAGWAAGLVFLLVLMAMDGFNSRSIIAVVAFLAIAAYALLVHPRRQEQKRITAAAHDRERLRA